MALALMPILAIALLGWFWFDSETFLSGWNVSGGSDMHAISRAASMALWAYMGIESAAVSAGVIENPKRNIPLATLIGLGLAAVVYMLSSTVIMGILPNAELQTSHAPFAEAARLAIGTPGVDRHQRVRGAEVDGLARRLDAAGRSVGKGRGGRRHVSHRSSPGSTRTACRAAGLVVVAVLMTVVLFATMSPTLAGQFNNLVDLAVILIIVPYIYSAVAVVKVILRPGTSGQDVSHLQMDRDRRGHLLPVGHSRRRSRHGRARNGGAADQRAALSILHSLDGSRCQAQGGEVMTKRSSAMLRSQ